MSSFEELRRQCLRTGELFEDPDFPADNTSMFYSKPVPVKVVWKRPTELVDDPKMTVDGATRFDVVQGSLGDSWLLAAMGSLCQHQPLFDQVVPPGQDVYYAGLFRFNIWQYGEWKEVIVDDRLPTYRGSLLFTSSSESGEFWPSLLEKAYAKLLGSYEALTLGTAGDAMEDFTGGVVEVYDLTETTGIPPNLSKIMEKSLARQSLMGCYIEEGHASPSSGLLSGQNYSVTSVQKVTLSSRSTVRETTLIRLRTSHGNNTEWTGAWSDRSRQWRTLSDSEKERLGLSLADDGEFWMSYPDMVRNFSRLEICHLSPDAGHAGGVSELLKENGSWCRNSTAGGNGDNPGTFWKNPQYRFKVVDTSDDGSNSGTIVVALMQERKEERDMLNIGFAIYRVEAGNPGPLNKDFFLSHPSAAAHSFTFTSKREISGRFILPSGSYCIVPSTLEPNREGDFFLRVFEVGLKNKDDTGSEATTAQQRTFPTREARRAATEQHQNTLSSKFVTLFNEMCGEDGEIEAHELQTIFNGLFKKELNCKVFPMIVCQSLISAVDTDKSGKLGIEEFKELVLDVKFFLAVFNKYRLGAEGLRAYQLRGALLELGFPSQMEMAENLKVRFTTADVVVLPEFLAIVTRLNVLCDIFSKTEKGEKAEFTLPEMLEKLSIV